MQMHQSSVTLTWHVVSGSLRGFLVARAGSKAVGRRLGIPRGSTGDLNAIHLLDNDERWLIPDLEGKIMQAAPACRLVRPALVNSSIQHEIVGECRSIMPRFIAQEDDPWQDVELATGIPGDGSQPQK
jgi:hypothetical protein